jgi:hypothetical protein
MVLRRAPLRCNVRWGEVSANTCYPIDTLSGHGTVEIYDRSGLGQASQIGSKLR